MAVLRKLTRNGVVRRDQDGRATSCHLTESGHEFAAIRANLAYGGALAGGTAAAPRPTLMLWRLTRLPGKPGPRPLTRAVAQSVTATMAFDTKISG